MKFPKLKGRAVLSPMAGITDVAFRTVCKRYGAALTYTEFLSSAALVRGNNKTFEMLKTDPIEDPVAVQLFGNNAEEVIKAAKIVENNFDIIDINCGCPVWKVIRTGAGSELLKDKFKLESFVRKLVSSVNIPVTIKIRIGINENSINALEIAKMAENAGAAAIAIHGRTQEQGYSGIANWEIIKEVKENISIPVIGNGDVFTPEKFKENLEFSKVDAIMVARGAIGNPYIFKQINDFLDKNSYDTKNKFDLFFEYLEIAENYNLDFGLIKNHAILFTKGIEGGSKLRLSLSNCNHINELKKLMELQVLKQ